VDARGEVLCAGGHVVDLVVAVVETLFVAGDVRGGPVGGQRVFGDAREAAGDLAQLDERRAVAGVHVQAVADGVAQLGRVVGRFVGEDGRAAAAFGVRLVVEDAGGAVERR